ncbi:MAG: hypothetical protein ACTSU5_03785, partial [Promethearchaeota archaeon]
HFLATRFIARYLKSTGAPHITYVDTEGTFRPERIVAFCNALGLDEMEVLPRVVHARASSFFDLLVIMKQLRTRADSRKNPLIFIDSVTHLYREAIQTSPSSHLITRKQFIDFLSTIGDLSSSCGVTVVATNQITHASNYCFPPHKPVADTLLQYFFKERLYLSEEGEPGLRSMSVVNSFFRAPGETKFRIQTGEILDA